MTVKGKNFGPVEAKGHYEAIYVLDGDDLKKQMETWNLTPSTGSDRRCNPVPSLPLQAINSILA